MKPKLNAILLLSVLLLAGCNPLRRMQSNQKVDSTTIGRSEIRKVVTDILHESGSLTQTIIEFYPPTITPSENNSNPEQSTPHGSPPESPPGIQAVTVEPLQATPPAVKRIVRTEINTQAERTTTTDSTAHNDIRTQMHSRLSDKVVEKPPATVSAIKWVVAGLVAILLIIVILKISKIKLPRIKL